MSRPRVFLVDTNVWLAFFVGDDPTHQEAMDFIMAADELDVTLVYTPSTAKDVFYVIPRECRRQAIRDGVDVRGVSFVPDAWAAMRTMTEIAAAAHTGLPPKVEP
jgi:predicted nucleic acid-binding protein